MKKIVILEDNEYEAEGLINDISFELGQKGHNRFSLELAHDIDELNEKLFNNRGLKEEYNDCCLILDLSLDPDGLEKEYCDDDAIIFSGWYWLKEKKDKLAFSKMKIIFYSAFVDSLLSNSFDECNDFMHFGVTFINKNIDNCALITKLLHWVSTE